MLSNEIYQVVWSNQNRKYYESIGYNFTFYKDVFNVNYKDLKDNIKINAYCDYCLVKDIKTIVKVPKIKYVSMIENKKKICCKKCRNLKSRETLLNRYNVANPMQIKESNIKNTAKRRHNIEYVIEQFIKAGFTPMFQEKDYKSSNGKLPCICNKHKENGIQFKTLSDIKSGKGCETCGVEKNRGSNSNFWKGGKKNTTLFLRHNTTSLWIKESLNKSNYRCDITGIIGKGDLEVHHLYPFNKIINDLFKSVNINYKEDISEYSNEELNILINECKVIQSKHQLGKPLLNIVHILFHKIFGKYNNTLEQYNQFKEDVIAKKYNNELYELSLHNKKFKNKEALDKYGFIDEIV